MTIFTVNPVDDGYFEGDEPRGELERLCMATWRRTKFPVRVFDFSSPEVMEAKREFPEWTEAALEAGHIPMLSDMIRLYIMSLYPDMMYMDTDVYIRNPGSFASDIENDRSFRIVGNNFFCMRNGQDTKTARGILERNYRTGSLALDKAVARRELDRGLMKWEGGKRQILHFPQFGNPHYRISYTENPADIEGCSDHSVVWLYRSGRDVTSQVCYIKNVAGIDRNDRNALIELAWRKDESKYNEKICIGSGAFRVYRSEGYVSDIEAEETEDGVVIRNRHLVMPQLFYRRDADGNFILSTDHKHKNEIFPSKGFMRSVFRPFIDIKHSMWGVEGNYRKMLGAREPELPYKVISSWSEVRLSRSGDIEVRPNDMSRLYSVPVEDSYPLIREWEEKYMDTVADLCRRDAFIPTLTGGCDTRILTHFWRRHNLKYYRLRAVKKDGKNNVRKGLLEMMIAGKVLSRMGKDMERLEEPPRGMATMCGTWTESTQHAELLNDRSFITDVVNRCNFEWYQYQPFADDLYLMIRPEKLFQMRVLFMLLFCPDLLDIEIISEAGDGVYVFKEKFKDIIDECRGLVWKWTK